LGGCFGDFSPRPPSTVASPPWVLLAVTVDVELLALSVRRKEYADGILFELTTFSIVRFLEELRLLLLLVELMEFESEDMMFGRLDGFDILYMGPIP
jgi:hypothetical protein